MTRTRSLLCAAVLTLALLPSAVDAQDGPAYAREREVTVTGTVADIKVGQNPWSNFRETQHWIMRDESGQPLSGALAPEKPKRWTTTRIVMLAAS